MDYLFLPQQVQVPVGTTVNFSNSGTITHTATAQDNSWDSGDIQPGQVVGVTFDYRGLVHLQLHAAPVDDWQGGRPVTLPL